MAAAPLGPSTSARPWLRAILGAALSTAIFGSAARTFTDRYASQGVLVRHRHDRTEPTVFRTTSADHFRHPSAAGTRNRETCRNHPGGSGGLTQTGRRTAPRRSGPPGGIGRLELRTRCLVRRLVLRTDGPSRLCVCRTKAAIITDQPRMDRRGRNFERSHFPRFEVRVETAHNGNLLIYRAPKQSELCPTSHAHSSSGDNQRI